eukprot:90691_1
MALAKRTLRRCPWITIACIWCIFAFKMSMWSWSLPSSTIANNAVELTEINYQSMIDNVTMNRQVNHQAINQSVSALTVHGFTKSLTHCFAQYHSHKIWNLTQNGSNECVIHINQSHSIHFMILDTIANTLFIIKSLNSWDFGQQYIIKRNKARCNIKEYSGVYPEYNRIKYLNSFHHILDHTVRTYTHNYPVLRWKMHGEYVCIMFMQHLQNTTTLQRFLRKHKTTKNLPRLNTQMTSFLVNCYFDMMSVLDVLWNYQHNATIHNDLHSRNILVDTNNDCHLIDYEMIFQYDNLQSLIDERSTREVREFLQSQSPFSWYYLCRNDRRMAFVKTFGNNNETKTLNLMRNYGYLNQKYRVQMMFVDLFIKHIKDRELSLIQERVHQRPSFAVGLNWSEPLCETRLISIWCDRHTQISLVIDVLNKNHKANEYLQLIDIFEQLYIQLNKEMKQTNVSCSSRT